MRVQQGNKTPRRFGVVGAWLGAALAFSAVLGLAPAEATVNTKTVKVYTGSLAHSFYVIRENQDSTCFNVSKTNSWTTTNIKVNVGNTVWVRTFSLGCDSASDQLIDSTPHAKVPADDLQFYWVTTKE